MMPQTHGILNMLAPIPPNAVLDHVDAVANGTADDPVTLSFQATNNGGSGDVTGTWYLYTELDVECDGGYEDFTMDPGTDTYTFTGLYYPSSPGNYYYKVNLPTGSQISSNIFTVTD
jgi:hypothetical protein